MALTTGLSTTTPPPPTGARRRPTTPTLGASPLAQSSMQILQQSPMQSRYTPGPDFGTPMNAATSRPSGAEGVGYGGGSSGYGTFSGSTARTPNVSVVAGAGPYNSEMARITALNRVRSADSPGLGAMTGADAAAREYERANQYAERNSPAALLRLRDELDRRTRQEIAERTAVQQRNAQLREDELLGNARRQQVADRNAATQQRSFEALLNAGAFGTATPASMGTDRRGLNLSALSALGSGGSGAGGGLARPGARGSVSVGPGGDLQTGDVGLATRIGETPADRYWAAKRANDLEGEQIALQNARLAQQWASMDRATGGGGGGGATVRSNATTGRAGGGAGGAEVASYDPTIFDQMLARVTQGLSGPSDVEMPAAPERVAAPVAEQVDDSAAFGRARSRIGQGTTASLRSLQDAMTARGISGSGIEGRLMADVYGQGLGALGEASRDAAIEQINRDQQVADMGYQGALTQRGQDLGYLNNTVATRLANANRRDDWTTRLMAARQALQGLTFGASLRY